MNELLTSDEEPEVGSIDPNVIHAHFYPPDSFIESLAKGVPDARERILAMMEYDLKETHRARRMIIWDGMLRNLQGWSVVIIALILGLVADWITGNYLAAALFVSVPLISLVNILIGRSRSRHD